MPYGTYDEDIHTVDTTRQQPSNPIEVNPSMWGPNLERNLIRTSPDVVVSNIEFKASEDQSSAF